MYLLLVTFKCILVLISNQIYKLIGLKLMFLGLLSFDSDLEVSIIFDDINK